MTSQTIDNQSVLHCSNCGGNFFEENGINRITLKSAQLLNQDKKSDEVSGQQKKCPKDASSLSPVENGETIPQNVTLLRCPTCKGIFTFADDLLKFKEAQAAKLNYFKAWNMPLPSLRAVLVLSLFLVLSVGFFSRLNSFLQYTSQQSQASDLIKKVYISKFAHYIFISFKSERPFLSKIVFTDKTENTTIEKNISVTPKELHQLTTTDVKTEDEVYYQIILVDEKGKEIKTEKKKLNLQ